MTSVLFSSADPNQWLVVGPHFWTAVVFVFGCAVGGFLNVCVERLPLGESLFSPPSRCPHGKPWVARPANRLPFRWPEVPGWCQGCGKPAPARYLLVQLLTAAAFVSCWLRFGPQSVALALVCCLFVAGLIVATATDFEHLMIPDEITFGGMIAGVICSILLPRLHDQSTWFRSLGESLLGLLLGGGGIYAVIRGGKMLFGRQRVTLPSKTRVVFTETAVQLPDKEVPFEELFYRKSDTIALEGEIVELADRCYRGVRVRLSPEQLQIGTDVLNPEAVSYMEVVTGEIVLPREAMGLGDAKLMAGIGAFLGWTAVLFTITVAAMAGSIYGIAMIALRRRTWSGRLYFGPFLALGAVLWIFDGQVLVHWYQQFVQRFLTR